MRYLVLSDIHANMEALEAVLADAEGLFQQAICLGDIVGYGPDPNQVTAWVRQNCDAVIRGNHDRASASLEGIGSFNPVARAAAEWTNAALEEAHRDYLRELVSGPMRVDDFELVHGSPFDEDAYLLTLEDAWQQFDSAEFGLTFFGHTHVQGGFCRRVATDEPVVISTRDVLDVNLAESHLVNPGSVGQPRDHDWKAAYAIYDSLTRQVEFRRCRYDVDTTQRKIVEAGLPAMLAERLGLGR